jgi:hypothetical protein
MTNLLRAHPLIALGRERYNSLFKREGRIDMSLFQKERFCRTLVSGDSHHTTLDAYYRELYERFDQCELIGDKIPSLYRNYSDLDQTFSAHKVIFMVRNIFDVAFSFEGRREHSMRTPNAPWPVTQDYRQAVSDWNLSLTTTLPLKGRANIMVVEYETLYFDHRLCDTIFDFLGLNCVNSVREFWFNAAIERENIEQKRVNGLSSPQKQHIMKNANFRDYKELVSS